MKKGVCYISLFLLFFYLLSYLTLFSCSPISLMSPYVQVVVLDEYLTLKDIAMHFWDAQTELVLHFRLLQQMV